MNGQLVFHAHGDGGWVHHFQAQVDGFDVSSVRQISRLGVLLGVAVVDAVHLGGFDQHIRVDLHGAQGSGRIGGEDTGCRCRRQR